MGEASAGRSATSPTFFRSTSVRTRIEWQNSQVVCTALDQRNFTGAPQLGQFAARVRSWLIGPLHLADGNARGAKFALQQRFKVGAGARAAAEQVQAQRSVLGESMAGQMRFR